MPHPNTTDIIGSAQTERGDGMTREEAIKAIDHIMYSSPHESTEQIVKKQYYAEKLIDYIADAEPIRHARWEYDVETAGFKCTECGKRIWGMTLEIASGDINYCPKCGADMRGTE